MSRKQHGTPHLTGFLKSVPEIMEKSIEDMKEQVSISL